MLLTVGRKIREISLFDSNGPVLFGSFTASMHVPAACFVALYGCHKIQYVVQRRLASTSTKQLAPHASQVGMPASTKKLVPGVGGWQRERQIGTRKVVVLAAAMRPEPCISCPPPGFNPPARSPWTSTSDLTDAGLSRHSGPGPQFLPFGKNNYSLTRGGLQRWKLPCGRQQTLHWHSCIVSWGVD